MPPILTVTGTVTAVHAMGAVDPRAPISEHSPMWAFARIEVPASHPGGSPTAVDVRFATSDDVAWVSSPKLRVGQRGTFTLESPNDASGVPVVIGFQVNSPGMDALGG